MKQYHTMRQRHIFLTLCVMLLAAPAVQAQTMKHRMAERYAAKFDFTKVAKVYEDIIASPKAVPADYRALASAYKKLGQSAKAAATYKKLIDLGKPEPQDLLAYADQLRAQGKYKEATTWYWAYSEAVPEDEWVKQYLKQGGFLQKLESDSTQDQVRSLPINSAEADLAPAIMNDLLLFSSARGEGVGGKRKYNWDREPFLNLYSALLKGTTVESPMVLRKDLNSRLHDGTASFDSTRQRLYFTRDNIYYGKLSQASNGEVKLGIYFSDIGKGEFGQQEWGPLVPFQHNNPEYNLGQPSVSPNGNRLYFVSDMPGGHGGTDIWYCDDVGDEWSAPKNIGTKVNTPGNEMYPFVTADSTFYFSSTGHPGLGGYDIFMTHLTPAGAGRVFNLGPPMNSVGNDQGLVLLADDSTGFFASDRPGGMGSDDIYGCTVHPPTITIEGVVVDKETQAAIEGYVLDLKDGNGAFIDAAKVQLLEGGRFAIEVPYSEVYDLTASRSGYSQGRKELNSSNDDLGNVVLQLVKYDYGSEGIVRNGETKAPMDSVKVQLLDGNGNVVAEMLTLADGKYSFPLTADKDYVVRAEKEGFFKQSARISTKGQPEAIINTDFNLFPLKVDQVVRLDNIYYDLAKWNIRPDAALELDKLVQTLQDNPTVKIELSAHTDCRGRDAYNMTLSQKRAKSAVEYLIKQGISKDRLTSKGYGETKPVADCACAKCTDAEHQANRRTEFKVLSK